MRLRLQLFAQEFRGALDLLGDIALYYADLAEKLFVAIYVRARRSKHSYRDKAVTVQEPVII
jgi:hypothetical protein